MLVRYCVANTKATCATETQLVRLSKRTHTSCDSRFFSRFFAGTKIIESLATPQAILIIDLAIYLHHFQFQVICYQHTVTLPFSPSFDYCHDHSPKHSTCVLTYELCYQAYLLDNLQATAFVVLVFLAVDRDIPVCRYPLPSYYSVPETPLPTCGLEMRRIYPNEEEPEDF